MNRPAVIFHGRISGWRTVPLVLFYLCSFVIGISLKQLIARPIPFQQNQSQELRGAVSVTLDFGTHMEHRAGLVVGNLPEPLSGIVALFPSEALYTEELDPVQFITSSGSEGKLLDVPTVDLNNSSSNGLGSLNLVGLTWSKSIGIASCVNSVVRNQSVRIVTADPDEADRLISINGRVDEIGNKPIVRYGLTRSQPKPGDVVFVQASGTGSASWRVYGIVQELLPSNYLKVLTLPELFRSLPSEAGAWALQPMGLCDPNEYRPEPGISNSLIELLEMPLQIIAAYSSEDGIGLANIPEPDRIMKRAWPEIRRYLSQPEIEHYYFNPNLRDEQQFGQFWLSILATVNQDIQFPSPIAAPSPVARLRAQIADTPAERGWAVAVKYTEGAILFLTANHLVRPASGRVPKLQIYLPALQGFPLEAFKLPFYDKELDLAVIAVETDEELRNKVFNDIYQSACPDDLEGTVEVPVNTWGWRLDRHKGVAKTTSQPNELRVEGINVLKGFSGSAIIKNGIQIAGIITGDLGSGKESIAADIHAGLRLIPFGETGILPGLCRTDRIEDEVLDSFTSTLLHRGKIETPTRSLLQYLFQSPGADRIKLSELPNLYDLVREEYEPWILNDLPASLRDYIENEEQALILNNTKWASVRWGVNYHLEVRPAVLTGQNLEPESMEQLKKYAPIGADGLPSIKPEDTIGCDLPRSGPEYPRPYLKSGLSVPLFAVMPKSDNDILNLYLQWNNRLWDANFMLKCKNLEISWYEPPGWLNRTAGRAPAYSELVQIPSGPFEMGGCIEEIRASNPNSYPLWSYDCYDYGPSGATFRAHTVSYKIQSFPVTVAEYARCVLNGGCTYTKPETDLGMRSKSECNWGRPGREDHPMNCITWSDAVEYCREQGGDLPTEAQWEKAARGTDGRKWPWGSENLWKGGLADYRMSGTVKVGIAPDLISPFGLEDIGWHIMEWTAERYHPYHPDWTGKELLRNRFEQYRVLRGFGGTTYSRRARPADDGEPNVGFRCVF